MSELTVGSRVAYTGDGTPGTIVSIHEGAYCCDVLFDNGITECIGFGNLRKTTKKAPAHIVCNESDVISASHHSNSCDACHKTLYNLRLQSPVILDELWERVLKHYNLSEHSPGPQLPAITPMVICADCMENALGRKLLNSDFKDVPFNSWFKLHYFYNVPLDTVNEIHDCIEQRLADDTFKTLSERIKREYDCLAGILLPFEKPELKEYVNALYLYWNKHD